MAIILANDGIDKAAAEKLRAMGHTVDTNKYEGDDLLKRLAEVDCIVVRSATKMRDPQIDAGAKGKLKLIIRAGVGIDNINVDYAEAHGMTVKNTPTASSSAVAELALAQMFAISRHIVAANLTMRKGEWNKKQYKGKEIAGKTLGLIGYGRIAKSLADKCRPLGMKVIYTNRHGDAHTEDKYVPLDELLATADYVSCHVPFAGGKAMIGADEIAKMKDGVYIVNLARGGVVDEDALYDALKSGKVAGAAIDVFTTEPVENCKLLEFDNVSVTPHVGASTSEAQARIGDVIVDIVKEIL